MPKEAYRLLQEVNQKIIQMRSVYSEWSKRNGLSYHKLLVYYTLYHDPECTQAKICNQYFLPKQTVHSIVMAMQREGLVTLEPSASSGREKRIVLTDWGREKMLEVMEPITKWELQAIAQMGPQRVEEMVSLMTAYHQQMDRNLNGEDGESR